MSEKGQVRFVSPMTRGEIKLIISNCLSLWLVLVVISYLTGKDPNLFKHLVLAGGMLGLTALIFLMALGAKYLTAIRLSPLGLHGGGKGLFGAAECFIRWQDVERCSVHKSSRAKALRVWNYRNEYVEIAYDLLNQAKFVDTISEFSGSDSVVARAIAELSGEQADSKA